MSKEDVKKKEYELEFENIKKDFNSQGYKEKDVTIKSGKAMIMGVLYSLPFVIVLGLIYRFFLIDRAYLSEATGITFYIMFILIIAISVIVHELLHGIGWAISSKKGWKVVRFNISAMMPSCACKTPLTKRQYLIGVLLPFIVLGIGSIIFLFVYPGTVSVLTMAVNFIAAGGDLIIAFKVLKEKNALITDHPTKAGYVAFYK